MDYRRFGKATVSAIGLGTWQFSGTDWGEVPEEDAFAALEAAADTGITFIDTADMYGAGRSEQIIGRFLKAREDRGRFFVATKLGRRLDPGWPDNFSEDTMRRHTEESLGRLGVDALDLTQTHSLPLEVMQEGTIFANLRRQQEAGLIRTFGASVESIEEALVCLQTPGLASLQIIFNVFRQRPVEELFSQAAEAGVAVIVRLPLASGLLSGKFTKDSSFPTQDHRHYNCDGQAFNVGETFSGLPFQTGIELVEMLRARVPHQMSLAQFALRWCLDFPAVTTVIPGARRAAQVRENAATADLPELSRELHQELSVFYQEDVHPHVRGKY